MTLVPDLPYECPECGIKLTFTPDDVAQKRSKLCPNGHTVTPEPQGLSFKQVDDAQAP